MPRVKQSDDMLELELRITPCDGLPITDWKLTEDHHKFIAFEEGGNDSIKRLHYHCYIEYKRSRTYLLKWIYTIAHCNNGESGNTVFFSRKPHDHTFGYISKEGKIAIRQGIDQPQITEWFKQSEDYKRHTARDKKRKQRTRNDVIDQILDDCKRGLNDGSVDKTVQCVIHYIMMACTAADIRLPTRSSMEGYVVTLLAPHQAFLIMAYYARSFSFQ